MTVRIVFAAACAAAGAQQATAFVELDTVQMCAVLSGKHLTDDFH